MTIKSQILKCLTKPYLYEIAKDHEISGAYRMTAEDLVRALSRKPSVDIEGILNDLSLQDLKIICQSIGLDDKCRTKALLIDRLLERDMKERPISTRKSKPNSEFKPPKKKEQMITNKANGFRGSILSCTDMNNNELERRLWAAADQLRANSALTAQEYSRPVLGLIFLKYADHRFSHTEKVLDNEATGRRRTVANWITKQGGLCFYLKMQDSPIS